jgi:hypothetical protein
VTDDQIIAHIQSMVSYEVTRLMMSTWGKAEIAKTIGEITTSLLRDAADKIKETASIGGQA